MSRRLVAQEDLIAGSNISITKNRNLVTIASDWPDGGNLDIDKMVVQDPWLDVRAKGAAGDGSTDDTDAIQTAIDTVIAAGGGTVYFPCGNYLISDTLEVNTSATAFNQSVRIRGENWTNSRIFGEFDGYLLSFNWAGSGNAQWRPEIDHLMLDGVTQTSGRNGLFVGACLCPMIHHVFCKELYYGIVLGNEAEFPTSTHISDVDFSNCNVDISAQSFIDCWIDNMRADQSGQTGNYAAIMAVPTTNDYFDNLNISDVKISTSFENGIYISVTTGSAGTKGRNTIGHIRDIMCEATTTKGLVVNGSATYGRLRVSNWYGDGANLLNIAGIKLVGIQAHGAWQYTACTNVIRLGCLSEGSGSGVRDALPLLPVYADNATARGAGLETGDLYCTSTGTVMVVYTP